LSRKTHRHDAALISQPPANGPTAVHTPESPDHAPMARERSSALIEAERRARLPGTSNAPPIPCTARAISRVMAFGASPHIAEAPEKATRPMTKTRRRPRRSPNDPPRIRSDPSVSR